MGEEHDLTCVSHGFFCLQGTVKHGSELSPFIWELEQIITYMHIARNSSQMLSHLIPLPVLQVGAATPFHWGGGCAQSAGR